MLMQSFFTTISRMGFASFLLLSATISEAFHEQNKNQKKIKMIKNSCKEKVLLHTLV
jgi:hypothetical protein